MMRRLLAVAVIAACGTLAVAADDKKTTAVEWAGLKGTAPADWTSENPSSTFRSAQFKLEKEKGDPEDAQLAVFKTTAGGGVAANLERQVVKFKLPDGVKKEDAIKVDDVKVGDFKGKVQDLKGTYKSSAAPNDPNAKVTEKEKFRMIYVIFEDDEKTVYTMWLVGPEKTVEKHKKAFDEFVKSFKK
jgi:hypothetical protein